MAVNLSPIGNDAPFLDSSGNPLSGGLLYTYTAGSSDAETTYTTSAGSVANANPVVLNSNGYPAAAGSVVSIWLTAGVSYKFTLKTSAGVTVWERDNIDGINDTTVTIDEWVSGPTPTYVSGTQFTLVGDQTSAFHVGRKLKITDAGGTKYCRITVSAFTTVTTVTVEGDTLASPTSAVRYGLVTRANTSLPAVEDDELIIVDPADPTKRARIDVGGVSAGQTRVLTVQDSSDTLVGRATTDTLTNKTINLASNTLATTMAQLNTALSDYDIGVVKLNSGSVSAAATLDIAMTSYTAYRNKRLVLSNFLPATDNVILQMQVSTDGGSTYLSTAIYDHFNRADATNSGLTTTGTAAGSTALSITNAGAASEIGNASTEGVEVEIAMLNTTSTAREPVFWWAGVYRSTAGNGIGFRGYGHVQATQDTDAVRILFSSGNIAEGEWTLYGWN
jgi:hypothetical protein